MGLIYGVKGFSFYLGSILINLLDIPPKLLHLLGIFFHSISMAILPGSADIPTAERACFPF